MASIIVLPVLDRLADHFNLNPQPHAAGAPNGSGMGMPAGIGLMPAVAFGGGGRQQVHYMAPANREMYREMRADAREGRDEENANKAACIGAIGTIVLAGLSAFALRSYCNDRKELADLREFRDTDLAFNPALHIEILGPQNHYDLHQVVDKSIGVLEAKCGRSRNIVILAAAALATGIAAFLGGMLAIKWLITASIITGVALAAIGVFMVVWNCTANDELPPAVANKVNALREHFENNRQHV